VRITRVKVGNRQAPQQQTETPPRKGGVSAFTETLSTATVQHLGFGTQAKCGGQHGNGRMSLANILVSFRPSIILFLSICNKSSSVRHTSFRLC
jgi:hypothetical protein